MDSPPPTQVPLARESFGLDTSRLPPASPPPMVSTSNNLSSPPHSNNNHLDRDSDALVSMSNGLAVAAGHHPQLVAAHAHAAALAAAQYHNQTMLAAAHAHSARHPVTPMNPMIRKNMLTKPGAPYPSPPPVGSDHACKMIKYRDREVAAFMVDQRELICLPQAFDLFLKDLVGGLHTVYTKLKRLDIQPVVCNVEQVRILRGLGAIAPGVNRCKLISCSEFDVLYDDCTNSNARPGRPPKRSPSIHHANPETLDKLNKKREEMGYNFDPRYYGEPKAMLNGFPHHPWTPLNPYLHMGVNPMMAQPMSMALAASQFAMRADNATAGKDRLEQEAMNRQSQERLASLGIFSPPALPADHHLAARHPDDPKPMNLSNGHARSSMTLPIPSSKALSTDDDDDEELMNEEKNTDEENEAEMDDNSNDATSDIFSNRDLDKSAVSEGRPEIHPVNGNLEPPGQSPGELDKVLQSIVELAQKAVSMAHYTQHRSRIERGELMNLLRDNETTIQGLKSDLNETKSKNEELRSRLRRLRKDRRLLQEPPEGPIPTSPNSAHNGSSTTVNPEVGLDLALKPASSPEEPTRTQTTDATESESEGDKNKSGSDRDREMKLSESSDRGCLRDSFDVFTAAAALATGGGVAGGSPPVRFPAPYLSLIGSEIGVMESLLQQLHCNDDPEDQQ